MPHVNDIFDEIGLVALPQVIEATKKKIGENKVTQTDGSATKTTAVFEDVPPHIELILVNTDKPDDEKLTFKREIKTFSMSGSGKAQEAEASISFSKRNLWIEVLSLTENDLVNNQPPSYVSDEQITYIRSLAKQGDVSESALIKGLEINSLGELPASDYENCIARLNANIENVKNAKLANDKGVENANKNNSDRE